MPPASSAPAIMPRSPVSRPVRARVAVCTVCSRWGTTTVGWPGRLAMVTTWGQPWSGLTVVDESLPTAVAGPVLMVAVPLELLTGPPMVRPTPIRPPDTVWPATLVEALLVELLPMAVLLPVLAWAWPRLTTLASWKEANRLEPQGAAPTPPPPGPPAPPTSTTPPAPTPGPPGPPGRPGPVAKPTPPPPPPCAA